MIKLLFTYIKSLFTPTDITLTLNGSQLTFTKEGDIKLAASRNLITQAKYIFLNGKEEDIEKIAYEDFNHTLTLDVIEIPKYVEEDSYTWNMPMYISAPSGIKKV